MPASSLKTIGFATLIAIGLTSFAQAQLDSSCSPFYGCDNDLQWFEPVDLDLDCQGCCDQCGFFLSVDKVWWAATGERVEVGDPNVQQRMFRLYSAIPLDPVSGQPIAPPILPNSIQDAVPRASFSDGDRYEFGYWNEKGEGWLMSILNGPDDRQSFTLGLNGGSQGGLQDGNQLPIGDVYVGFRTSPGLLASFLDIDEGALNGILGDSDAGNGILDGDGFADDVNDNGQHGADGFDTEDPFNEPDAGLIGALPDYGDLVIIPISFGTVNIRNTTKLNGFEIMRGYRLDNSHFKVAKQNNRFEVHYGARFLQLDDEFVFDGLGVTSPDGLDGADWSIGDVSINNSIINNMVGPQLAYKWVHARGRWNVDSIGKVMFGYNIRDWKQRGFTAEDATPGRVNNPLYVVPQSFSYGRSDQGFSPVAELRLNLSYRLTDNIKAKVGYTGTFAGNIRRASTHVDYNLYENGLMGFRDVNEQEEIFTQGVNIGIEIMQ